jgi:DNA mismatch repair protein MutS2
VIHPETFEAKIGFDNIRSMLLKESRNDISHDLLSAMKFTSHLPDLLRLTGEVDEYLKMMTQVYGHPDPVVHNFTTLLDHIRVPGSWFEPEVLPDLHEALTGIGRYLDFFRVHDELPFLRALTEGITLDAGVVVAVGGLLDEKGEIRDSASPELAKIRKEINAARLKSERTMRRILKEAIADGVVGRDTEFTVKNGRFVIPVPAARKRQLKGYVHDESGTGQTFYIEPAEVLELVNEVRELELAERREIIRILVKLADLIRPHLADLVAAFRYAGYLDFIRAKARIAIKINGVRPEIVGLPVLQWMKAVHPLLYLSLQEQGRRVVPLDISLDATNRILIISGPNAGGKSVCLKTVGLLQYMLQCGMLIPVHPNSTSGIFTTLFIDIGDQQSIENDLSTYSSHLMNLRMLLEHADRNTLFLIDEMGSGTEPNTGGAIAEAALEMIAPTEALGVVTTHYANLKLMAGRVPGIVNGAMLFDTNNMQPLYKLRAGKPGSSFAFEIAGKTGLPELLLQRAMEMVGKAHYEFETQIQSLELEKEEMERKQQEMKVADAFLAEMIEKYSGLYQKLDESRKEILITAKREAKQIVEQSNRLIEKTIREIREAGAEKLEVKRVREELQHTLVKLEQEEITPMPVKGKSEAINLISAKKRAQATHSIPRKPIEEVKPGDWVTMKDYNKPGEVLRVDGKKVTLGFGTMQVVADLAQLEWSAPVVAKRSQTSSYSSIMKDINEKSANFSPEIDVRGQRAVDALSQVRTLVDDAILLSVKDLRILHGKGDGILRQVIRNYLEGVEEVKSFQDEHIERGGFGITVVTLR